MTTKYVAGFMFRNSPSTFTGSSINISTQKEVALVLKDRPDWQRGKLNAIGGKISGAETPTYAMVREFAEETGSETKPEDWREFCVLGDHGRGAKHWQVHFFVCLDGNGKTLRTAEKEEIAWHPVCHLLLNQQSPIIPNLRWLIPLALDKDQVFGTVEDISNF